MELFENIFTGGIDGDVDPRLQKNNTYRSAKNIEIIGTSNLYVAKNIAGTTEVQKILSGPTLHNLHIIGAYACTGEYTGTIYNSLLIFTYDPIDGHKIYLYNIIKDSLHTLANTPELNFSDSTVLDVVMYTEKGYTTCYFIDYVNELRKVKCIVDGSPAISSSEVLGVRRKRPLNELNVLAVEDGGKTYAGSYQFFYRFYNSSDNRTSTYSLISNPVPVTVDGVQDDPLMVFGGVSGSLTNKKIKLSIDSGFSSIYDSVQLGVVKNTSGTTTPELTAYLLPPSKDIYNDPTSFYYDGSAVETQIDIADVAVEDAAIKTFKTITLKNNRLIGGNVKYSPLDYDNGAIELTDAYTITHNIGQGGFREYTSTNTNSPSIANTSGGTPVSSSTTYTITIGSDVVQGNYFALRITDFFSTVDIRISYVAKEGDTNEDVARNIYDKIPTQASVCNISKSLSSNVISFSCDVGGLEFITSVSVGAGDTKIAPESPYAFKNEVNTFNYKSAFRGEVYRYGITYTDGFNWSPPQVLDFSQFSVFRATGPTISVYSVGRNTTTPESTGAANMWFFEMRKSTVISAGIKPGNYVYTTGAVNDENNGFFRVVGLEQSTGGGSSLRYKVYVDETLATEGTLGSNTVIFTGSGTYSSRYNQAEIGCIDWKYPNREVPEFTILDSDSNIQSIGLRLTGIKNHPSWAKAMAIVRAKRNKNIIFQAPHIPVCVYQQAYSTGDFTFSGNTNGIYGVKKFLNGIARNIGHEPVDTTGHDYVESMYHEQTSKSSYGTSTPLSFVAPADYMMNTDGQSFSSYEHKNGDILKVVDACTLQHIYSPTSGTIAINGLGVLQADNIAMEYYAESKDNYYNDGSGKNLLRYYNMFRWYFDNGVSKVREAGLMNTAGAAYQFSYFPTGDNVKYPNVNKYGDYASICNSQTGVVPVMQKGIILGLDKHFGDLTYVSFDTNNIPARHISDEIKFGRNVNDASLTWSQADDSGLNAGKNATQNPGSSTVIVNLERGLADTRYGDRYSYTEYMFTGSYYVLSDSEVTNNTPIDLDVFGGDCFISRLSVKTSSSNFGVGFNVDGVKNSKGNECYRAVGYADEIEFVTAYVESEVNCEYNAQKYVPTVTYSPDISAWRVEQIYPYNNGYSTQNIEKIFTPRDYSVPVRNEFQSRLIYSNQKVYQSNIEGFDRWEALSVYDQDETYGPITKLARKGNGEIFSLQTNGLSRIPVQASVIEDAQGNNLTVRSGDIIGIPQYISVNTGCQHIETVAIADRDIYFTDIKNMAVWRLGDGLERISDHGAISFFNRHFKDVNSLPDNFISGHYNFNRGEYILNKRKSTYNTYDNNNILATVTSDPFVFIYNSNLHKWTSELSTDDEIEYKWFVYADKQMYMLGRDPLNNEVIRVMYDQSAHRGDLMGKLFDSEIEFIINPKVDIPKVFSNLSLNASDRAKDIDMVTFREGNVQQQVLGMNFDILPRETLYRIPTLFDINESRLRGTHAQAVLRIDNITKDQECRIYSMITKYRPSFRFQ